jgi:hypothetical protein
MIFFVTFLRAMAACFITNAHYTGIYPTDLIANGGLIGDVLFFAVSGFCLYNVKFDLSVRGFAAWYGKRIWRIYPPVIIMTAVFMLLGAYQLNAEQGVTWWYIYPTNYHFVASIIVLYIPLFFIVKISVLKNRLGLIIISIAIAWFIVFCCAYDHSYYHIDKVREPMIRFLFMESMLLGAWFRQNDSVLRNKFSWIYPIGAVIVFFAYFASKLLFVHKANLSSFQFLNQIVIFLFLYLFFRTFCGLDSVLEKMPTFVKKVVGLLSDMTLEIYLVQYVIIDWIRNLGFVFPLNWIVLTVSILLAAFVLHKVWGLMSGFVDKKLMRVKL